MSDRFESYETTLRNCLTESKEALEAKGVTVPEETKLRNVPALIDGIEVGHAGNAITINCKSDDFLGQILTAKHTDGTTVTKVIDSLTAIIEIPKDGEWTVTNSITNEEIKFNFDTVRDLYSWSEAYLKLVFIAPQDFKQFGTAFSVTIKNPDSTVLENGFIPPFHLDQLTINGKEAYKIWTVKQKGEYQILFNYYDVNLTKRITINENKKTYEIRTNISESGTFSDPSNQEQPSIDGIDNKSDENIKIKFYAVDTTKMTDEQIEKIFSTIDSMIAEGKSEEEINSYIESKEAEYGQI